MVDKLNTYTIHRPRLKKVIGWSLVVLGFAAVIAPVVPGAPILFVGLELLGLRLLFTDKLKNFFTRKPATEAVPVVTTESTAGNML